MTSARPRSGIVRQQSLQQQPPKRPPLRKQLSEEQITPMIANESGLKISLPPKNKTKPNLSSGPRVRAAWIEKKQNSADHVEVVAKKCEQHRQSRMLLTDKDILYTRQELAERLRKAWREREKGKQNLDIFLAPNTQIQDVVSDVDQMDAPETADSVISASVTPTKTISKVNSTKMLPPSGKPDALHKARPSTAPKPMKAFHFNVDQKENVAEVSQDAVPDSAGVNNVTITPMTAAMRRSSFQNQSRQSAFNATVDKPGPPLQRALSNPMPSPVPKEEESKMSQNKRKLKTRRRFNKDKDGGESSEDENKMSPESKSRGRRGLARSRSVAGAEVVTMVSLISPTASDSESDDKKSKQQMIINNAKSVAIRNTPNPLPYAQAQKRLASLRKSGKSVSFQDIDDAILPPGNSTGRCLSAMLSLRRGSMAPRALARASSATTARNFTRYTAGDQEEFEYQNDENEDEHGGAPTMNVDPEDRLTERAEATGVDCAMIFRIGKSNESASNSNIKNAFNTKSIVPANENEDINKISGDSEIPIFYSQKEKECWQMYQRMSTKGVVVAFDTILRGMLTPTEYRLRKKCEEKDNLEKLQLQKQISEESQIVKE